MKASTSRYVRGKNVGFPKESMSAEGDMRVCLAAIMNFWLTQQMGSRLEFQVYRTHADAIAHSGELIDGSAEERVLDDLFAGLNYDNEVE